MASVTDIIVRYEARPCMIANPRYGELKALWHKWVMRKERRLVDEPTREGTDIRYKTQEVPYGLIEKEDGKMVLLRYDKIRFVGDPFEEFAWEDDDDDR